MITFGRAAAVVSPAAIANNIGAVRRMVGPKVRIMAVVKANGYGHGIYEASRAALEAGADWLGVATVTEGVFLRRWDIMVPILVLSPAFEEEYENIILNNLASTIFNLETAKKLAHVAGYLERAANVHIKIDTGMNRVGYTGRPEDIAAEITEISRLDGIVIQGAYSHFAASDSNAEFTTEQFARFMHIIEVLENFGLHIPIKHISNSGGILGYPRCNLDMVRAGVLIYGLAPNSLSEGATELARLGFVPALTLKSRVAHVKTVKAGETVGYSRNFAAPRDIVVASVPIGYGDGLSRQLSNRGRVLINGVFCDIIGNVCMDQFMVDATHANAKLRDEVIIIGQSGENRIWAEDVAAWQGSINYEVATAISERVARFYV
ncbi:MAG: alanine racemase [Clostridiales bacterium]|jgi:alanine racemase|nr:alanine racemase [Clostridiales bacterium]